jgi:hypothetical protein
VRFPLFQLAFVDDLGCLGANTTAIDYNPQ